MWSCSCSKPSSGATVFCFVSECSSVTRLFFFFSFPATPRISTFFRLPNPRVCSKEKRNQSPPVFRVVFKLSQVPPAGKEGKKEWESTLTLLNSRFLQGGVKTSRGADVLTCGGPRLCWRGPRRWTRRRPRCEWSVQPERSRATPLSLPGSLLPTHTQTSHL